LHLSSEKPVSAKMCLANCALRRYAVDGISPLHFACQKGHFDTAKELLAAGANPKALTYKAENALHFAAAAAGRCTSCEFSWPITHNL
jgi:ankyrin repeat protein